MPKGTPVMGPRIGKKQRALINKIAAAGGTLRATVKNGGRTVSGQPTPLRNRLIQMGYITVDKERMTLTTRAHVKLETE